MSRTLTLSFELLEAFVALIRSGGDAAQAMRALGINQPAMSKRLRHVQHAGPLLDRPWVVRHGKTWELTDEGKRVWPAVLELVERHENLQEFLGKAGAEPVPTAVRFACGQQIVAGLVAAGARICSAKSILRRPCGSQPSGVGRGSRASPTARSTWRSSRMMSHPSKRSPAGPSTSSPSLRTDSSSSARAILPGTGVSGLSPRPELIPRPSHGSH